MAIDFKTDEMMSFYYLWKENFIAYGMPEADTFLASFDNPKIKNITQTYPRGCVEKLAELGNNIQDGKISDIDGFISFLDMSFSGYSADKGHVLKNVFEGYHQFYISSQVMLSDNADVMRRLQDDVHLGYKQELDNLYKVFGVNPESDKLRAYINPVPERPLYDGMSQNSAFYQNISIHPQEGRAYIENSTVCLEKISTPFHEATHHIFARSQLKQDIKEGQVKGRTKEVMAVLSAYMEATKDKQPRGGTALSALDEAFAACSSAIMYQKINKGKLPDEWYHGFDAANRLAPKIFPLYMEYLEQGKPLDEKFFMSLSKKLGSFRGVIGKARCAAVPNAQQKATEPVTEKKSLPFVQKHYDGRQ